MSVHGIEVHLSRLKLMTIEECDTEEAMDAIMDAIKTALTTRYPESGVSVTWQTGRADREYDLVEVEWRDEKEDRDTLSKAEAAIAQLVELAEKHAISALSLPGAQRIRRIVIP